MPTSIAIQSIQHLRNSTSMMDAMKYANSREAFLKALETEEIARFLFNQDNACVQMDAHIRDLDVRIAEETKINTKANAIGKMVSDDILKTYKRIRAEKQSYFNQMNCQNQLEKLKLQETAQIITTETQKYDSDVLENSKKTSQTYLIIGGGILLISLFIILNSNKK